MSINTKATIITAIIMMSILVTALYPTGTIYCLVSLVSTALIIYLVYSVLNDDYVPVKATTGPSPGYAKR